MSGELLVSPPPFSLLDLPSDASPPPSPPPPLPPKNPFPTLTELLQDLPAQDDHTADRHEKCQCVERARGLGGAAQGVFACDIRYIHTDPDTLSPHNKRRLYLDCLEQYIGLLHDYILAIGYQPIHIKRVLSGKAFTPRSTRTLFIHLRRLAYHLHYERHVANARLRERHAYYREKLAQSASVTSCQQPGPPQLTGSESSAVATSEPAPVTAADYVTTCFGPQGVYTYTPAPVEVQASDAYSNSHCYSALSSDLDSAAITSVPSMSTSTSTSSDSDFSTPTLAAHPSSALTHGSCPSFAPGPAFNGSANDYGSGSYQQLQAERHYSVAITTIPDSPAVTMEPYYADLYPFIRYQSHLLPSPPYQHRGSSCTPDGQPPAAREFSPLSPVGYYSTDADFDSENLNGNGGHDGHEACHPSALYAIAGHIGQHQYVASDMDSQSPSTW